MCYLLRWDEKHVVLRHYQLTEEHGNSHESFGGLQDSFRREVKLLGGLQPGGSVSLNVHSNDSILLLETVVFLSHVNVKIVMF